MSHNRQWVLRTRPVGEIGPECLELVEGPIPTAGPGEVVVRTLYLSLDPTNRIWMSDMDQYLPPVQVGEVMRGGGIGQVVATGSDRFPVGALVNTGLGGWQDYVLAHQDTLSHLPPLPGVPLTAFMSVLGATGLTAWFGMVDICKPEAGETVVVSAAAGAVGSVAAQLAKRRGARVIGIAGGKDKCRWLAEDLKLDGVIDYKSQDVGTELDRLCPNGIDCNFENVGGAIMNDVINRMNNFGRVALCGMISTYNGEGPASGLDDFARILMRRLTIKGFIIIDYLPRAGEAFAELAPLVLSGELQWKAHVVDGLENAAEAVKLLFSGAHDGKLMVKVGEVV